MSSPEPWLFQSKFLVFVGVHGVHLLNITVFANLLNILECGLPLAQGLSLYQNKEHILALE